MVSISLSRPQVWYSTARAYFALTKPGIIALLLVTTIPAMVLAAQGEPSPRLMLITLLAGFLAAGGANAINCYIDRDIDVLMARTQHRPLPQGAVEPWRALYFGIALGTLAFVLFSLLVNLLSALLAMAALLFYVMVYTRWLKRSTALNIVIGGAAGAMPPVIGWAAVTGQVTLPAVVLFMIIFLWTPPHFWALALRYRGEYATAKVPMLPVIRGEDETRKQIFLYTLALTGITVLLVPLHVAGLIYLAAALALGGWFLVQALQLWQNPLQVSSMRLFGYSILYLALLFGAMVVDQFARVLAHRTLM
jgi:heme o synthase